MNRFLYFLAVFVLSFIVGFSTYGLVSNAFAQQSVFQTQGVVNGGNIVYKTSLKGFQKFVEEDVIYGEEVKHRESVRMFRSDGFVATGVAGSRSDLETFTHFGSSGWMTLWDSRTGVRYVATEVDDESALVGTSSLAGAATGGYYQGPEGEVYYATQLDMNQGYLLSEVEMKGTDGRAGFAAGHFLNKGPEEDNYKNYSSIEFSGNFEYEGFSKWEATD